MTTICVSRALRMMVSDSRIAVGSTRAPKSPKMWRLPNCIVGIAGTMYPGQQFVQWLPHRKGPRPLGDYEALALYRDGRLGWWLGRHNETLVEEDFYAIGSGQDFALGAMQAMQEMGLKADPRIAVRCAARHDVQSEEPIRTLRWVK
ncbi:MAG: hypothetical protein H0W40_19540 [Methylibium sp.]|uniref:hypothetical protein n=1 Tax=Methylibium sp. TaxID=2067992 RepID=UPI00182E2581|nr:hypothetical protein [Methylibium sp.]MBA3599538.1 hypothetical protein [Methylibium sp.]